MKDFVAIDIETSGMDEKRDTVIQFSATKVRGGEIVAKFCSFVFREEKLSLEIIRLTGFLNEDLEHAPTLDAVIEQFRVFREGLPLIGYNTAFDKRFLKKYADFDEMTDVLALVRWGEAIYLEYSIEEAAAYLRVPFSENDYSGAIAKIYLKLLNKGEI